MSSLELRVPPVAVVLAAGALMWVLGYALPWPGAELPGRILFASLAALAGIAVAVAGIVEFRRARTTVNPMQPEKASSLVDGGILRITRNPMYLGMALVLLGWAIWLGSLVALLVLPLFTAYLTRFQIIPEERALAAAFGDAFAAYRHRVRRWL
jgi:protein-S-isoprenylcysteine O-methyltransferase Ste14